MAYHAAWTERRLHAEVLAARERGEPEIGRVLLVEHDPVITVTKRPGAIGHLLASPELLTRHGVELVHTDRGGDITYHGPGQLVCYPIIDLQLLHLRLHEYMRLLEQAVIDTIATFGLAGERDPSATGVWVRPNAGLPAEKICAMGVRVSRWISMHGLALNVTTNLDHFGLIVPCGFPGAA
ncbi:MAG: lipoyl(octanoyl) transferase LipB [Anaerolineae bacterium]|nr:lipoyl(octanoyl) transferase LipB [Anaerolineae bacterium]